MKRIIVWLVYLISRVFWSDVWKMRVVISNTPKSASSRLLMAVMEYRLYKDNCSYIGPFSEFDDKPIFPHGIHGIFISNEAHIGKDCVIFQQVTIGSNTLLDSPMNGSPLIRDNCYIGCGAKIIGKCVVGNNCRIGAGAVVTKDVPDNSVVVGFNNVVKKDNKLDNRFVFKDPKDGKTYVSHKGAFETLNM